MSDRPTQQFRYGVFNPTNFIIAVIDDRSRAEQAAAALRDAGFSPDAVRVVSGQEVLDTERRYHASKGVLAKLAGLYPSEEAARVKEDMPAATRGAVFLAVKAPEPEQQTDAARILASHGAYAMRYYGNNTVTDL